MREHDIDVERADVWMINPTPCDNAGMEHGVLSVFPTKFSINGGYLKVPGRS